MLRNLIGAVCAVFALSSAASATVFHIDGFANHNANGFPTSGFFLPYSGCHYTCGDFVEVAEGTASGAWKTDTGKIRFTMDLVGGGTAKANGWVDFNNPVNGSIGEISMTIAGSANGYDGSYSFLFRDWEYNAAAGVQGATNHRLALLGVAGDPKFGANGGFQNGDLGVAMRAQVSAVPVPPALALMLAGLGGLGFVGARRARKTA